MMALDDHFSRIFIPRKLLRIFAGRKTAEKNRRIREKCIFPKSRMRLYEAGMRTRLWWRETNSSLYRQSFLSPFETSKSFRRVLVRGLRGIPFDRRFFGKLPGAQRQEFQKKLVAKGKSPMKKRLVMNSAALYRAKKKHHQPVSGESNHLTLDREDAQAVQVLCTPGVVCGALPVFFGHAQRIAQESVNEAVDRFSF